MLILRQNNYSWKDLAKTLFRGAVKELAKEYQDKDDDNSDVFGDETARQPGNIANESIRLCQRDNDRLNCR